MHGYLDEKGWVEQYVLAIEGCVHRVSAFIDEWRHVQQRADLYLPTATADDQLRARLALLEPLIALLAHNLMALGETLSNWWNQLASLRIHHRHSILSIQMLSN